MATSLYNQATRAFKEADFWQAIELSRQSIELSEEPLPARYHLLGRALTENPRWRKDAEANLKIAIKLEPSTRISGFQNGRRKTASLCRATRKRKRASRSSLKAFSPSGPS